MSKITDGMFAYIGGTVSRVFESKTGTAVTVEVKREGAKYPDRVTVWGVKEPMRDGDRVKFKGWISWASSERDGKKYFNVSLNNAELMEHENDVPAAVQQLLDEAPF